MFLEGWGVMHLNLLRDVDEGGGKSSATRVKKWDGPGEYIPFPPLSDGLGVGGRRPQKLASSLRDGSFCAGRRGWTLEESHVRCV